MRTILCVITTLTILLLNLEGLAQSTSVELLGTITAQQASEGLGFNIDANQDWQWAAAAAAGATHARIQCSWSSVEQQSTPPQNLPASPQYIEDPNCTKGFTSALKYGIHPTVVAAYGPPYHNLLSVTLPKGASKGATRLYVEVLSGVNGSTLANLAFPYDYICPASLDTSGRSTNTCSSQFSAKHSYQGTLVSNSEVTDSLHAELSLASALTSDLPSSYGLETGCSMNAASKMLSCTSNAFTPQMIRGTRLTIPGIGRSGGPVTTVITDYISPSQVLVDATPFHSVSGQVVDSVMIYSIQEVLYPSAASENPSDPSVQAYGNYVSFLAQDMAAHSLQGDIEIWNEPPWANDPWDFRAGLYDNGMYPGPAENGANYGFVANLQNRIFPEGITATWNGTSGNGAGSLLASGLERFSGVELFQPSKIVTKESFHPYGNEPEQVMWDPDCLRSTAAATKPPYNNPFANGMNCYLPGEPTSANFMFAVQLDLTRKLIDPTFGITHSVTETGILPPKPGLRIPQARFVLRQFLGFEAEGVTPVEFYKLYDAGNHEDPSFSFVEENGETGTYLPNASFTALSGLMADIKAISAGPPEGASNSRLGKIITYSGTYPLSVVQIVGSRPGASMASDFIAVWQRSYTSCSPTGTCGVWITQPSPVPGQVTLSIPEHMSVSRVVNLTLRSDVDFASTGDQIRFMVTDDPVEILLDPTRTDPARFGPTQTTLTLKARSSDFAYGHSFSIHASLNPFQMFGKSVDGERILFYDGTVLLGASSLLSGTATWDVARLAAGRHVIRAVFPGDESFTAASGEVDIIVSADNSDFSLISIDSTPKVVSADQIATFSLLVKAIAGLPGNVALSCHVDVGSCSVDPSSVYLGAAVPVKISVSVAEAHGSDQSQRSHTGLSISIASVICFVFNRRRSRLRRTIVAKMLLYSASTMCFMILAALSGCGSEVKLPLGKCEVTVKGVASTGSTHTVGMTVMVE